MGVRSGFVGLGNIGAPMAERLVKAGFETAVYDVNADALQALAELGAKTVGRCRELAAVSDVVGVCVRDDRDVEAVVYGPDGLLAGAAPGMRIALHSTVLPSTVRRVAEEAAKVGVSVVDACITGGRIGAVQGTLTYIVGGEVGDLEYCRPAFETSAAKIVHTGELGTGAATKLCNNLMTYLSFASAYESMLLAKHAGLSQEALEEVTLSNGNMTPTMQAFLGLHKVSAEQRQSEDMQRMLAGFTDLAEKDLAVTLAYAREVGVTLPATAVCQQIMARVYGVDDERRR